MASFQSVKGVCSKCWMKQVCSKCGIIIHFASVAVAVNGPEDEVIRVDDHEVVITGMMLMKIMKER